MNEREKAILYHGVLIGSACASANLAKALATALGRRIPPEVLDALRKEIECCLDPIVRPARITIH